MYTFMLLNNKLKTTTWFRRTKYFFYMCCSFMNTCVHLFIFFSCRVRVAGQSQNTAHNPQLYPGLHAHNAHVGTILPNYHVFSTWGNPHGHGDNMWKFKQTVTRAQDQSRERSGGITTHCDTIYICSKSSNLVLLFSQSIEIFLYPYSM